MRAKELACGKAGRRDICRANMAEVTILVYRCQANGLAFITGGASGQVYLVGGNFISPAPPSTLTPPPTPAVPQHLPLTHPRSHC